MGVPQGFDVQSEFGFDEGSWLNLGNQGCNSKLVIHDLYFLGCIFCGLFQEGEGFNSETSETALHLGERASPSHDHNAQGRYNRCVPSDNPAHL